VADDLPRSVLLTVCEGCADRADQWDQIQGWHGRPGVDHRDRPVGGHRQQVACAVRPANDRCLAGLPGGWLALTAPDHDPPALVIVDGGGVARQVTTVELPAEPSDAAEPFGGHTRGPTVHAAPDGRSCAVVCDYGRYGLLVDLATGAVVRTLDRGEYRPETQPFPIAYLPPSATPGAGQVLIVATGWNRLDAVDAATGRLLTDRRIEPYRSGEPRPEHYLDYLHGRLTPGPSGRWLLDDGWVWHPIGVPLVIDAASWLAGDTYAAEHGQELTYREYAWDQPVAWVDDRTVAIQRIGHDDDAMIDGVQLSNADTGECTGMFAGPTGHMYARAGLLYVTTATGLEIWDPTTGTRTGQIPDFHPTAQQPVTGTLAALTGTTLDTWTPP
jgi:hypothetical protein